MEQNPQLSKKLRGILFDIKNTLKLNKITLQELVFHVFSFERQKLSYSEFSKLIKEADDTLSFGDIDELLVAMDPEGEGEIDFGYFAKIFKGINDDDDPYKSEIDQESENIMHKSKIGGTISETEQVVLIIKNLKDNLKGVDPHQLLDLLDVNRDGRLDPGEFEQLAFNFGLTDEKKRKALLKHVFPDGKSLEFVELLKALHLDQLPKRVNFNELDNKESHIRKTKVIDKNKKPEVVAPKKQVVVPQKHVEPQREVPEIVQQYFNPLSLLLEPLKSIAFEYLSQGKLYLDPKNPTTNKTNKWEHANKIFKRPYHLFEMAQSVIGRQKSRIGLGQMMEAKDIIQGNLGDCYFLSSIAGVVQHYPELLYRLFVFQTNPSGIYGVRLFIDGEWETVITDARFPMDQYDRVLFAHPHGNEIWVMLLEKAWAKIFGSYDLIVSGNGSQAFNVLTGAPVKNEFLKEKDVFDNLQRHLLKKYMVSASGSDKLEAMSNAQQENYGLFSGHAYSVLKTFLNVKSKGKTVTLLKLRNPWGQKVWRGNWSFNSDQWTPELRQQFNYKKDPEDGSFYMCEDHFRYYFNQLSYCFVNPKYVNSTAKVESNRINSVMFSFDIATEGEYTFSIYQPNPRKFKNSKNYEMSKSRIFIALHKDGKYLPVASAAQSQDNLHCTVTLKPGKYVLSTKVKWKYSERSTFGLASYGPNFLSFHQVAKDKKLIRDFITNSALDRLPKVKKEYYANIGLPRSYYAIETYMNEGFGFAAFVNDSNKILKVKVTFTKSHGVKPVKPEKFPIDLQIKPGETVIKPMLIDPSGFGYSISQSMSAY